MVSAKQEGLDIHIKLIKYQKDVIDTTFGEIGISQYLITDSYLSSINCFIENQLIKVGLIIDQNNLFYAQYNQDGKWLSNHYITNSMVDRRKILKVVNNLCVRNNVKIGGNLVVCSCIINPNSWHSPMDCYWYNGCYRSTR